MSNKRESKGECLNNNPLVRDLFTIMDAMPLRVGDVSDKLGYPVMTMQRWRNGTSSPDVFALQCLAEFCGYKLTLEKVNG